MDRAEQIARFQSQIPCPICGLDLPLSEHTCSEKRETSARERQVAGETFCKANGHVFTDQAGCVVCGEPQPAENGILGQSNHGWGFDYGDGGDSPFVARDASLTIDGKTYPCDIKTAADEPEYRTLAVQERFWNQLQQMTTAQHRLAHGARNTASALRGLTQAIEAAKVGELHQLDEEIDRGVAERRAEVENYTEVFRSPYGCDDCGPHSRGLGPQGSDAIDSIAKIMGLTP